MMILDYFDRSFKITLFLKLFTLSVKRISSGLIRILQLL